MSAIESPATMPAAWHESWANPMAMAQANSPHHQGGYPHPHMAPQGAYPHQMDYYASSPVNGQTILPPQTGTPLLPPPPVLQQKDALNNSDSSASSTASTPPSVGGTGPPRTVNNNNKVTTTTNSAARKNRVNFKLEIKPEPADNCDNPTGLQKVPSISDLSEADSSVDQLPSNVRARKIGFLL